jgi:fructokinase
VAELNLEKNETRGVVVFGEVLWDRFPDGGEVLGGAPFNVAWNLQGLGQEPLLVSRIGDDELGKRVLRAMTEWGMTTAGVQVDDRRPTGTVEVGLDDGEPVFDIVADRAFDEIDKRMIPPLPDEPLLYHGSLICRAQRSRDGLKGLVERCEPSIFFDVNLRPPWWERSAVEDLLRTAREVKMNEHELNELMPGDAGLETRARDLLSLFDIERLHVTRGSQGALVFTLGGESQEVGPENQIPVIDTVGAGDAYSSVLILGRLRKWPLSATLKRAQEFAAAVVGRRGALTTEPGSYEKFREAWKS